MAWDLTLTRGECENIIDDLLSMHEITTLDDELREEFINIGMTMTTTVDFENYVRTYLDLLNTETKSLAITTDLQLDSFFDVVTNAFEYTFECVDSVPVHKLPGWTAQNVGVSATSANKYAVLILSPKYDITVSFSYYHRIALTLDYFEISLVDSADANFKDTDILWTSKPSSGVINNSVKEGDISVAIKRGEHLAIVYAKLGSRPPDDGEVAEFYNLQISIPNRDTGGAGMSKGIYLGVSKPAQVVLTPSNIGKYFTITPVSNNLIFTQDAGDNYFYPEPMEDYNYFQMRFTALKDIVLDVTYNCSVIDTASLFVISNGVFNSENTGGYGEGTGRTTIKQGDFLQVTLSLATVDARNDIILFKLSAIEAGSSVARKVKKIYVGVKTEVPVGETVSNVALTKDKFNELFADDVGGGSTHKWISQIDNAGNIKWCPDNLGKHNINSMSFFKAKQDMTLSFDYNYTTELNYDKVSISIGDLTSGSTFTPVTIIANALSGVDGSSSWSGNIKKGQYLRLAYSKDSSGNAANESVCVENFKATYTAQTGTTLKEIARKVKKAYIGVNGVARLCYSSE